MRNMTTDKTLVAVSHFGAIQQRRGWWAWILFAIIASSGNVIVLSGEPFTNVPPALEIEILDPRADPLGNPAVELKPQGDTMQVEIPPVILVHRYYYSGDRSFQAQMLPGGPTIVVANHPKTGERCYIPVQMTPGAPRVTYTAKKIEYDFGRRGITIAFGLFGKPTVKYRNSEKLSRQVAKVLHSDSLVEHSKNAVTRAKSFAKRTSLVTTGALVQAKEMTRVVTLPAQHIVQVLPFGKALFSGDLEKSLTQKAMEHQRQKALAKAKSHLP